MSAATPAGAGRAASLAVAVASHVRRDPDGIAVVGGGATLTWAQLDRSVAASASALADAVGPTGGGIGGWRMALVVRPSVEAVIVLHAAIRTGATVALLDPRLTRPELDALLAAVRPAVVVADDPAAARAPSGSPVVRLAAVAGSEPPAGAPSIGAASALEASSDGATFLVPTSGTTGRPRLARLPVTALEASARAWSAVLPPSTGWLLTLGLAHVAGIGIVVRSALDGAPLIVPAATDTAAILTALGSRERSAADGRPIPPVSHLSLVATQLARLLDAAPACPAGVRAVLLGGGPIPPLLVIRALAAGWPVVPSYGLTETGSGVAALPTAEAGEPGAAATAGRPLPGVEIRIGAPLGPDGSGRIEVRGPMVFAGYEGEDEETAVATADALRSDGWLRTRDLGRFDDARRLVVIDRLDDLVIRGGENVTPAEVEAVLLRHPAVADAGMVGIPDSEWGMVPAAILVPQAGRVADPDDIRAFARAHLAGPKVPARMLFVGLLPRSASGKLLRRELRRLLDEPPLIVDHYAGPGGEETAQGAPAVPTVVLLHATLSSALQLRPLARRLESDARVLVPDRRGSGRSGMAVPAPLPLARHVADALEVLDRSGIERAVVVGHSFGGVVALELGARHPDRVAGLLAWEPPYLAVAPAPVREAMAALAERTAAAHAAEGPAAAARLFLDRVAGEGAWDALHPRQREAIGVAGDGVLADISMPDLFADGLARIDAPAVLATGELSAPFYHPIAAAVAARIPDARLVRLPGLRHPAPITDPDPIADLVRDLLAATTTGHASADHDAGRHEESR